jgi:hypothetical protein
MRCLRRGPRICALARPSPPALLAVEGLAAARSRPRHRARLDGGMAGLGKVTSPASLVFNRPGPQVLARLPRFS